MKAFNEELYIKKQKGDYDQNALTTLQILKERAGQLNPLFNEKETRELEDWKTAHPQEWAILENDEAFQELEPTQRQNVLFKVMNGFDRPDNPTIVAEFE